jgi:hypothetical protein
MVIGDLNYDILTPDKSQVLDDLCDIFDLTNIVKNPTCFMKAFDKVPHRRLLHKMHRYKISEKVIKWVESFLSNRTQKVIVNGAMYLTNFVNYLNLLEAFSHHFPLRFL